MECKFVIFIVVFSLCSLCVVYMYVCTYSCMYIEVYMEAEVVGNHLFTLAIVTFFSKT